MSPLRLLRLALVVFAACSPSVESGISASVGAGGGASASSPASASASIGSTGGAGGGGFVAASSSSTGGFGGACEQAVIEMVVDGDVLDFQRICPNGWGLDETTRPAGFLVSGGAFVGNLEIQGCFAEGIPGITAFAVDQGAGGNSSPAVLTYVDASGVMWSSGDADTGTVDVLTFGPIGTLIDGTFEGTVHRSDGATHQLSAKYNVCRVRDESLP